MNTQNGLTLLELIVTIAVATILTVAGVPAYEQFARSWARSTASLDIYRALVTARSEAIARNREVIVCGRDPESSPEFPQCVISPSTAWDGGWIVFADSTNLFASTEPDAVEDIIAVFHEVPNHVTVEHDLGSDLYLSFDGGGRSFDTFQFTVCDTDRELDGRRINIGAAGTVYLRETGCSP